MGKPSAREQLLEAGQRSFLEKGFGNAGIESILRTTGIPKGSFYYYFGSKEEFGLEVLDRFDARHRCDLQAILGDASLAPLDRLCTYFESTRDRIQARDCREGCLVGNLTQELSDHSEPFRQRLDQIFRGWIDLFAACVAEAQGRGDVDPGINPRDWAEFWMNSWQGALIRAKSMRSAAPLDTFLAVFRAQADRARG